MEREQKNALRYFPDEEVPSLVRKTTQKEKPRLTYFRGTDRNEDRIMQHEQQTGAFRVCPGNGVQRAASAVSVTDNNSIINNTPSAITGTTPNDDVLLIPTATVVKDGKNSLNEDDIEARINARINDRINDRIAAHMGKITNATVLPPTLPPTARSTRSNRNILLLVLIFVFLGVGITIYFTVGREGPNKEQPTSPTPLSLLSGTPTDIPSDIPSLSPTSSKRTPHPTTPEPTPMPTLLPTLKPTLLPTLEPSPEPTPRPTTSEPTFEPTTVASHIFEIIESKFPSSADDIRIVGSKQYTAYKWVIENYNSIPFIVDDTSLLQIYGLVVLYLSTNGYGWDRKDNWLSSGDYCNWNWERTVGVRCNANNDVVQLNLYKNNLRGTIPAELGALTALTYLKLSANSLSGTIPTEIGRITRLEELLVWSNYLTGTIPSQIEKMRSLNLLRLPDNKLSGRIPAAMGELTALTFLDIHNNKLTGPIPSQFEQLLDLTYLDLRVNNLSGNIPEAICNQNEESESAVGPIRIDCGEIAKCSCCKCG